MLTKKQIKNLHKLHDSMTKDSFFFQKKDNDSIVIKIDKVADDKFTITPYDISSGTAKQEKTVTVNETTMRALIRRYDNIKISNINEMLDSVKDKVRYVNEMPYRLYVDRGYGRWEFVGAYFDFKKVADKSEELQKQGYKVQVHTRDTKKVKDAATDQQIKEYVSAKILKGISDVGLQTAIRKILFSSKNRIDWQEALKQFVEQMPELRLSEIAKDSVKDANHSYEIDWIDIYARSQGYDKSIWSQTSIVRASNIHEALEKLARMLPIGFGTANCLVVNARTDGRTYQFSGKLNELLKKDLGDSVKDYDRAKMQKADQIAADIRRIFPDVGMSWDEDAVRIYADDDRLASEDAVRRKLKIRGYHFKEDDGDFIIKVTDSKVKDDINDEVYNAILNALKYQGEFTKKLQPLNSKMWRYVNGNEIEAYIGYPYNKSGKTIEWKCDALAIFNNGKPVDVEILDAGSRAFITRITFTDPSFTL